GIKCSQPGKSPTPGARDQDPGRNSRKCGRFGAIRWAMRRRTADNQLAFGLIELTLHGPPNRHRTRAHPHQRKSPAEGPPGKQSLKAQVSDYSAVAKER